MWLGSLLKKFSKNEEKRQIIREVIFRLTLEKKQEQLYFDSLEILDEEYLDLFYKKLVALVDIIEEKEIIVSGEKEKQKIQEIHTQEQSEKKEDFNILFDNI